MVHIKSLWPNSNNSLRWKGGFLGRIPLYIHHQSRVRSRREVNGSPSELPLNCRMSGPSAASIGKMSPGGKSCWPGIFTFMGTRRTNNNGYPPVIRWFIIPISYRCMIYKKIGYIGYRTTDLAWFLHQGKPQSYWVNLTGQFFRFPLIQFSNRSGAFQQQSFHT